MYALASLFQSLCLSSEKLRNENVGLKQQMTLKAAPTKGGNKDSSARVKEMEVLVARAAADSEKHQVELKQVTLATV